MEEAFRYLEDDELEEGAKEQQQWWDLIRSCCLAEDEFWYIQAMYEADPSFRSIFYNNLSEWFIDQVKQRLMRGSVNILGYGQQRGGKSWSFLFMADLFDPQFSVDKVVFELRDLQALYETAEPGSWLVCDEIKRRFGEGSEWEIQEISNVLETRAKYGVSTCFATPALKLDKMLYGINYYLEFFGYNPEQRFIPSRRMAPQDEDPIRRL